MKTKFASSYIGYVLIKYFIIFTIDICVHASSFSFQTIKKANLEGWFLAVFILLFYPVIQIILFTYPFVLLFEKFKSSRTVISSMILAAFFIADIVFSTYFTNQKHYILILLQVMISTLFTIRLLTKKL
jgi:hypothetical protein